MVDDVPHDSLVCGLFRESTCDECRKQMGPMRSIQDYITTTMSMRGDAWDAPLAEGEIRESA